VLRVGLTGSIAVGKSFVASVLAELGCHCIDADQTAREAVAPGSPGLRAISTSFGNEVIRADGTLDRERLAALVFADEEKRLRLNSILHPSIIARQDELLREWEMKDPDGIAVVDAALMIEAGSYQRFDKLVVVHCTLAEQLRRLMTRNNLPRETAEARIRAQLPQEEKKKFADYLIDTSDSFEGTRKRTALVYQALLQDGKKVAGTAKT
jgi:dephospho-CoA kinase